MEANLDRKDVFMGCLFKGFNMIGRVTLIRVKVYSIP